ncbi:MAG: hypothetical protein ACNI25_03895 [Halarcobacter sp.]
MFTSLVSCTVSEISAGKFANGVVTGAFVHLFNEEGGFRKLGDKLLFGRRGSIADYKNILVAHEGFILKDGTVIGFFPDGVRVDKGFTINDYSQLKYYDDDILLEAIGVTYIRKYDFVYNNCQDWASRVDRNYRRLNRK